jgi:translation initiation factor IF-3
MLQSRVNGRIRAKNVRVVDKAGDELGVFSLTEALNLAQGRREDLVEIGPEEEPPLCQVIDYGEYRWRLQEQQKGRAHD